MLKNKKIISTNKKNQFYFLELLNKYPSIKSGRKNYKIQYKRVLKNILITKAFHKISNKNKVYNFENFQFKENRTLIKIIF